MRKKQMASYSWLAVWLAGYRQVTRACSWIRGLYVDDKFIPSYDGAVLVQGLWEGKNQNVMTVWSLLL